MSDTINLFRQFVGEMDVLLKANDAANGKSQRQLLNELFKLESDFKKALLGSRSGELVYEKFVKFILEDKENKLSIRPYFRERQDTFSNRMFPILKDLVDPKKVNHFRVNVKKIHRFRINYLFIKWAMSNETVRGKSSQRYCGPNRKRLMELYAAIATCRELLCQNNLPLAVNRAKLFWSKTPQTHLDYMDLIQDASKGLIEAIDKFVPPYKTVFRSTAIGRMGLNMSEDYSSTMVKLPPKDKRILYRARKAKLKNNDISGEALKSYVNESFSDATAADIEEIEAAAQQVSIDYSPEGSRPMSETLEDPASTIDKVEERELKTRLLVLMEKLQMIEKKVLLMKHGEVYGILGG